MDSLDIRALRKDLGLTQHEFSEQMGIRQPFLSRIENGLDSFPKYFIDKINEAFDVEDLSPYYITKATATKRKLKTDVEMMHQVVPIYELEAVAGIAEVFLKNEKVVPVDHLMVPNLPKADGAMYARGDSMYPLVKNGDLVVYKMVKQIPELLIWGEMYILYFDVEGDEILTIKFVQQGSSADRILLVSQNQHHAPKEFSVKYLKAAALVKAIINYRSMI